MDILVPQWWDFLTLFRLFMLVSGVFAWLAVGWFAAPWVGKRFSDATSGYVLWMQQMFDRMFLEIAPKWCVLAIVVSVVVCGLFGWLLTSGVPYSPWGYNVIRLFVIGVLVT